MKTTILRVLNQNRKVTDQQTEYPPINEWDIKDYSDFHKEARYHNSVVMQYSGIEDQDQNLIFEHDIVQTPYGIGEVIFHAGCFMIQWLNSDAYMELLGIEDYKTGRPRKAIRVLGGKFDRDIDFKIRTAKPFEDFNVVRDSFTGETMTVGKRSRTITHHKTRP